MTTRFKDHANRPRTRHVSEQYMSASLSINIQARRTRRNRVTACMKHLLAPPLRPFDPATLSIYTGPIYFPSWSDHVICQTLPPATIPRGRVVTTSLRVRYSWTVGRERQHIVTPEVDSAKSRSTGRKWPQHILYHQKGAKMSAWCEQRHVVEELKLTQEAADENTYLMNL